MNNKQKQPSHRRIFLKQIAALVETAPLASAAGLLFESFRSADCSVRSSKTVRYLWQLHSNRESTRRIPRQPIWWTRAGGHGR